MFTPRWQPLSEAWSEVSRLQGEMNRLFGRLADGGRRYFAAGYPAVNLWEDGDKFSVEAELPGLELDDLEICVDGGRLLTIKGQRKQPSLDKATWHRQERAFDRFSRTLELPSDVDADAVQAHFKQGVLLVELPKQPATRARRIEVKVD